MNTHKEPKFKVGDRVGYGNTEWSILSISKAGTVSLIHATTRNRTVVSMDSLKSAEQFEFTCPHDYRMKGVPWCSMCDLIESTKSRPEEEVEPTPPSQIEEEPIYRLIMLWHDYNKHCYSGGTERSPVTFEEFITSSWLLNQLNNTK